MPVVGGVLDALLGLENSRCCNVCNIGFEFKSESESDSKDPSGPRCIVIAIKCFFAEYCIQLRLCEWQKLIRGMEVVPPRPDASYILSLSGEAAW